MSVGGGRVSVGIGVSVWRGSVGGIGVLVDSGTGAVQVAKVLVTAVSTAPGWGVDGAGEQAIRQKFRLGENLLIASSFLYYVARPITLR